jgi:small subunit ribosomal protein S3
MIERQIVSSNVKELEIQEYISKVLKNLGHSHIKLQRTPLGEKIIIHASRPGLIVGRKGQNIKKLTQDLKANFKLENPQIEISEVDAPNLDAQIIAERIASSLEKFGTQRFKGIGHRVMSDVMGEGAMGIEILISGKIPSSRAKRWRFYQGYLKKCGDIALTGVRKAYAIAHLKTGAVGIQVRIMPSDTKLPDHIEMTAEPVEIIEELKDEPAKTAKKPAKEPQKAADSKEAREKKKPAKKKDDSTEPAAVKPEAAQKKEEPKRAAAQPAVQSAAKTEGAGEDSEDFGEDTEQEGQGEKPAGKEE